MWKWKKQGTKENIKNSNQIKQQHQQMKLWKEHNDFEMNQTQLAIL